MFDVPEAADQVFTIDADLPIEGDDWTIGAIVGPSGSGKSVLLNEVFSDWLSPPQPWEGLSLLDDFPKSMEAEAVVKLLNAVGLSSPPVWLRPYSALSMGQQFRASLARQLAERTLLGIDEFTSVVDRDVAKAVSVSLAKLVRREPGRRVVVASCHRDFLEWLEPDWVYDTEVHEFRRGLWRRPKIRLEVVPCERSAWRAFRGHHYLTSDLSKGCRAFLALVQLGDERPGDLIPVGFFSIIPRMGWKGWWRGHRTVVLPDYQGLGIGNLMVEIVAEQLWRQERKRYSATTAAISIIQHRKKRPQMWRCVDGGRMKPRSYNKNLKVKTSAGRFTTSWEYIPEELRGRAA